MYVAQTKSETECTDNRFPLEQRRTFPQLAENYFYYKTVSLTSKDSTTECKVNSLEIDKLLKNDMNALPKVDTGEVQRPMTSQEKDSEGNIELINMKKYFGTKYNSFKIEKPSATIFDKFNKYISNKRSWECEILNSKINTLNQSEDENFNKEKSADISNSEIKYVHNNPTDEIKSTEAEKGNDSQTQLVEKSKSIVNNLQPAFKYSEIKVLFQYKQKTEALQTEGRNTNVSCDTDKRLSKHIFKWKLFKKIFCCSPPKAE